MTLDPCRCPTRFGRGVAFVLTLSGCNSLFGVDGLTYDGAPAAAGSGGTAGAGGSGGSGGSGGEAGGSGGEAGAISADISGTLLAESHVSSGGQTATYRSLLQAGFHYLTPSNPPACQKIMTGVCGLWECGSSSAPRPTAGVILVTGATHQSPLTLTPGPSGTYTSNVIADQSFFADDDLITFTAAGAEVPDFEQVVTSPGVVTVTDPTIAENMTIASDSDFAISWTGTTSGTVELQLAGVDVDDPNHILLAVCTYPVADGTGAVTTEALSALLAFAPPRLTVTNSIWAAQDGVLDDGSSWSLSAGARRGAITSAGADVDVWVSLQ